MPPLGLSYISEILSINNIEHTIKDFNIFFYKKVDKNLQKKWTFYDFNSSKYFLKFYLKEYEETIIDKIIYELQEFDIIGFSLFSTNRYISIKVINRIKELFEEKIIIGGGPDITLNFEKYKDLIDIPFFGDSIDNFDIFCKILIKEYSNRSDNKFLSGNIKKNDIVYFFRNIINENKFNNILIDNIIPKFDRFDLNTYLRKNCLPIVFNLGCIGKCKFCTEKYLFKVKTTSPESLIERILFYYFSYNKNWITFYDSMINISPCKLKEFLINFYNIQKGKKISFFWDAQFGIKPDVDKETINLFNKTGCINLFIGLESGSDRVLKKMKKLFNSSDAIEVFKRLNFYKIFFEISLIIGFPGETEQDFELTLKFLKENKKLIPKIAQINPFILYESLEGDFDKEEIIPDEVITERYKKLIDFIKKENFNFTEEYLGNLILK
ncbi:MAG: radical SAM protein [Spirochaetes bacterium]|nr:radical SAM protein [Spirochaetota bacterium]